MSSTRKVLELADRQGLLTEMRRRSGDSAATEARRAEGRGVTVSPSSARAGRCSPFRVAEALGWSAYDREILTAIPADTRSDENLLDRTDERGVTEFHEYSPR